MDTSTTKDCTKCAETKAIGEFGKRKGRHLPYCKACVSIYNKRRYAEPEYRANVLERAKQRQVEIYKDPSRREAHQQKWNEHSRKRYASDEAYRSALKAHSLAYSAKRRDNEEFEAFMLRMEQEAQSQETNVGDA